MRDAQRLEALEGQPRGDPRLLAPIGRVGGGCERRQEPPQQLPSGLSVIDAEQEVDADVWRGPGTNGPVLYVVQLKRGRICGYVHIAPRRKALFECQVSGAANRSR